MTNNIINLVDDQESLATAAAALTIKPGTEVGQAPVDNNKTSAATTETAAPVQATAAADGEQSKAPVEVGKQNKGKKSASKRAKGGKPAKPKKLPKSDTDVKKTETETEDAKFTNEERKLLVDCEETYTKYRNYSREALEAMKTIRDKKLFRIDGYKTFESYCQEKWGFSRQHASRMILAYQEEVLLSPTGDKPVLKSINQGYELSKCSVDDKKAVMTLAIAKSNGGPIETQALTDAMSEVKAARPAVVEVEDEADNAVPEGNGQATGSGATKTSAGITQATQAKPESVKAGSASKGTTALVPLDAVLAEISDFEGIGRELREAIQYDGEKDDLLDLYSDLAQAYATARKTLTKKSKEQING